jgi:lipid II:glycine glycyltransferase (peptidoglycan interpeptide bridge formation enzyme)
MTKVTLDNLTEITWDGFLRTQKEGSFLQSYQYGKFYQDLGYKIWRLGLTNEDRLVGVGLVVKLTTKLGNFLYLPAGPVLKNWERDFETILEKLIEIGRAEKGSFIRLDPRILSDQQEKHLTDKNLVRSANYTQPQCSQILDLTRPLSEIKSNFSESTRYNVGWVARQGVRVEISQNSADIDIFTALLQETSVRHHFRLHAKEGYYKKQFLALAEKNMAKLFLTKDSNDEVLSAAIVVNFGSTVTYLHAASSSKNPKLRAPYLMQWKIIENAKESGFKNYDFWGVAKDDSPNDPWAGVSSFKKSFGGEKVCYQKPYDFALNKGYLLEKFIEQTRPLIKKLRR